VAGLPRARGRRLRRQRRRLRDRPQGRPAIFRREDSRLFRREYVEKTVEFFEKHGARAIVLARFVPIVRTFITVTAGVGKMDRRRYLTYSGIGAVLWGAGVTVLGHQLGSITFIRENLELMALLIVAVSVLPVVIEVLRARRGKTSRRRVTLDGVEGVAGHPDGDPPTTPRAPGPARHVGGLRAPTGDA
jgi:hypothetical protein